MFMSLTTSYSNYLAELQDINRHRQLTLPKNENINYLDFSSNDYLFLSKHPEIIEAIINAARDYGIGSTGSRLLTGNHKIFTKLETQIALSKKTEAALIFNSGFQANFSMLLALLNPKILGAIPQVFFDKSNHASLYQAVFASNAQLFRYNHNDLNHLTKLLSKHQNSKQPKFIVTETLFGMDGDVIDIQAIADLAYKYNAFLYLDEAHATGILGDNGYGLSTTIDLSHIEYLAMGTFSKALGGSGGYIACSKIIRDYAINSASGFVYSTANALPMIAAAAKAWKLLALMKKDRQYLADKSNYLRKELNKSGFDIAHTKAHIIPIILKSEDLAIEAKEKLLQNNIIVSCIRPPTVPPGSSRLRLALNISHQQQDIDQLLKAIKFI